MIEAMRASVRVEIALRRHDWSRKVEDLSAWTARRLPLMLRRAVIVDAAVRATLPSVIGPDAYAGPDGLEFKALYDHAATPHT